LVGLARPAGDEGEEAGAIAAVDHVGAPEDELRGRLPDVHTRPRARVEELQGAVGRVAVAVEVGAAARAAAGHAPALGALGGDEGDERPRHLRDVGRLSHGRPAPAVRGIHLEDGVGRVAVAVEVGRWAGGATLALLGDERREPRRPAGAARAVPVGVTALPWRATARALLR